MKLLRPRDRRNCLLLSALLVLCYGPAIGAWARGGWAFGEDAPGLFAPWSAFADAEIRGGRWPLWNPWLFCGLPFALNGQAALGYPPNVLFWLLPFKTALLLDALAHSILLGLGGYFLGRALGLSRTASWLLGLCLGANGAVSAHVYAGHLTWHAARAWLPWMLWALARGLNTRRVRYAYALALFWFLQFAAGYPPLALASAGLCAAGFVLHGALSLLEPIEDAASRGGRLARCVSECRWMWRWGAIGGGLGLALVAALALPLREVSGLSVHGSGLPWSEASELSGSWKSFVRWVVPGLFNHARDLQWSLHYGAHEEASSIGILPTLLALGAPLWAWKIGTRRQVLVLCVLWCAMLGCSLLALGANTPLYRLLFEHLSLFRVLRFPVRWLEVWASLASIAAALSFDIWYRQSKAGGHKYLAPRLLALSMAALVVGACILGAACWLGSRGLPEFWRPLLLSVDPWRPLQSQLRLAMMLRNVAVSECLLAAAWCLASALLVWSARSIRHRSGLRAWKLAVALVAVELGALFARSQRTWVEVGPNSERPAIPASIAARYLGGERWVSSVEWRAIDGGMASGIEMFNGYDAMNTRAFWSLGQAVEGRALWVDMYQPSRLRPALRIAGVTHVLLHTQLSLPLPPGSRLEALVREWRLWRIAASRDVWPRLFLTSRVQSTNEPDLVRALENMARTPTPAPDRIGRCCWRARPPQVLQGLPRRAATSRAGAC